MIGRAHCRHVRTISIEGARVCTACEAVLVEVTEDQMDAQEAGIKAAAARDYSGRVRSEATTVPTPNKTMSELAVEAWKKLRGGS